MFALFKMFCWLFSLCDIFVSSDGCIYSLRTQLAEVHQINVENLIQHRRLQIENITRKDKTMMLYEGLRVWNRCNQSFWVQVVYRHSCRAETNNYFHYQRAYNLIKNADEMYQHLCRRTLESTNKEIKTFSCGRLAT